MTALTLSLKHILISLSLLAIILSPAMAGSDKHTEKTQQFRGVFYGVLPCEQCPGTAATLSLKTRNNYLLVTQKAQESSREFYEKGKYVWDDESGIVTLTLRKDSSIRKLRIKNDKILIMLSYGGADMKNNPKKFTLAKREQQESSGRHTGH
ncbi:MAG: copper homeostasis protein (lipoprotein) [Methyloprofundus sp.]|nr:MAG: copper homeostasis protein (lipoprotein) [Methyloprofundus sp.]